MSVRTCNPGLCYPINKNNSTQIVCILTVCVCVCAWCDGHHWIPLCACMWCMWCMCACVRACLCVHAHVDASCNTSCAVYLCSTFSVCCQVSDKCASTHCDLYLLVVVVETWQESCDHTSPCTAMYTELIGWNHSECPCVCVCVGLCTIFHCIVEQNNNFPI